MADTRTDRAIEAYARYLLASGALDDATRFVREDVTGIDRVASLAVLAFGRATRHMGVGGQITPRTLAALLPEANAVFVATGQHAHSADYLASLLDRIGEAA